MRWIARAWRWIKYMISMVCARWNNTARLTLIPHEANSLWRWIERTSCSKLFKILLNSLKTLQDSSRRVHDSLKPVPDLKSFIVLLFPSHFSLLFPSPFFCFFFHLVSSFFVLLFFFRYNSKTTLEHRTEPRLSNSRWPCSVLVVSSSSSSSPIRAKCN